MLTLEEVCSLKILDGCDTTTIQVLYPHLWNVLILTFSLLGGGKASSNVMIAIQKKKKKKKNSIDLHKS